MQLKRKMPSFALAYLLATLVILLAQAFFVMSPTHQQKIEPIILWPVAIALIALNCYRALRRGQIGEGVVVSLAIVGWTYLTCVMGGDPYLQLNLHFMLAVLTGFGVCYPVFFQFDEQGFRRGLRLLERVAVGLLTVAAALALYCALTGSAIACPLTDKTIAIKSGRLYMFSMHPNEIACSFVIGFLLALHALVGAKRLWIKLIWGAAALLIWLGVALTVTRTATFEVSLGLGLIAFLLVVRALAKQNTLRRFGLAFAALLCAGALCFGLFQFATSDLFVKPAKAATVSQTETREAQAKPKQKPALKQRDLVADLSTFTGRTEIWKSGIHAIKERPITLLTGMTDAQVSIVPAKYTGRNINHMHNIWLETLLLLGVPGLLLFLYLMARIAIACARLFFRADAPLDERMLAIIPAVMFVSGLMEIYPGYAGKVMDLLFFLISGAVVSLDARRRKPLQAPKEAVAEE